MLFNVIGWTIIHSLWQSFGLLALLKLFLGLTDVRRSGLRYMMALGTLGVAIVGVLWTFVWEWRAFAGVRVAVDGGGAAGLLPVATGGVVAAAGATGFSLLSWLERCCPYLTMVWVLGVVFYTGKLVLGGVELRKLRRLSGEADPVVQGVMEELRMRMDVLRPVRLLITDRVSEPMTFGFLRAVVVLPLSYVGQVPAEQLEMILAHEMAHIRRRDYVVNLVQSVFDALLFFNPFWRGISAVVREEREYCCDDRAAMVGGDQQKMAVALTSLGLVRKGLALGLSAAPGRRSLYRRVMRLIEPQERPAVPVRATLLGLLTAVIMIVVLAQCSRSVIAQDNLPVPGDRLVRVLAAKAAGHQVDVYTYTKGGEEHELFLVRTKDRTVAVSAYMDGVRMRSQQMEAVVHVVKTQSIDRVIVLGRVIPDSANPRVVMREQHMEHDELEVQKHELLTKIVTTNTYTDADRRMLNELIQIQKERGTVPGAAIVGDHDSVIVR